jgi:hypothetical protein
LKPRLDKREIGPGESGQFFVHVSTAGEQPGPREYTITVEYEDPEPRSVVLTFSLVLPPRQIYVTPRALLIYVFDEKPAEKEIVVSDNRITPGTVTAVETSSGFLSAQIEGAELDHEGVKKTRIEVKVSPVSLGRHQGVVKINTDDPNFPVINVPVHVHRQSSFTSELPAAAH